jgi:hypothetical protein
MNSRNLSLLFFILTFSLLLPTANAHIPIAVDGNNSLGTAIQITEHWKSWFYYSELDSNEIHYYQFEAVQGERIRFLVEIPLAEGDAGFQPGMILMGPGIVGVAPSGLESPGGVGVMVLESTELIAEYEGFTPLSQYKSVDLNMTAPETGTYYVAVFAESTGGRYALATGYVEAYSLIEWLTVPFMVIELLEWSGQYLSFILLLMLFPVLIGMPLIFYLEKGKEKNRSTLVWVGNLASLMILGSGVSTLIQMIIALAGAPSNWTAILTLIIAGIQLLLGFIAFRTINRSDSLHTRSGLILIILGAISPVAWAGLILGPILLLIIGFAILLSHWDKS